MLKVDGGVPRSGLDDDLSDLKFTAKSIRLLTKILKEANCKYSKDVWVRRCQNEEEKIVPAFAAQEEQTTTTYRIMEWYKYCYYSINNPARKHLITHEPSTSNQHHVHHHTPLSRTAGITP
jgi:phage/plasmid-associated DNA primase